MPRRLVGLFAADPPRVIYVSTTRRARETAAPLAAKLRAEVRGYDPGDTAALVARVLAERGPVLVVGHSNTVPEIVARLGGARPAALAETDYGDVWHLWGTPRRTERLKMNPEVLPALARGGGQAKPGGGETLTSELPLHHAASRRGPPPRGKPGRNFPHRSMQAAMAFQLADPLLEVRDLDPLGDAAWRAARPGRRSARAA